MQSCQTVCVLFTEEDSAWLQGSQTGLCALHVWPKSEQIFRQRLYTSIPTTFSHPNGDQVPETKVCALLCIFVEFAGRQSRLEEQTDNEWWNVFPPHCYSEEAEFLLQVQRKSQWTLWMTYAQKGGYYALYRLILKDKLHFSGDSGLARPSEGVWTVSTGFTPFDASNKWTISTWTLMVIIRLIHSPHRSHKHGNPQLNLAVCDFTVCNTCLTHLLHTFFSGDI